MGIDVQTFARRSSSKLIGKGLSERQILDQIDAHVRAWSAKAGIEGFYQSSFVSERSLAVRLVPAAESIRFDLSQAGLGVGLRTSTAGPGYHAAVIDLLDELADACQLTWDWGQGSDHSFDETDYARGRDFVQLQSEHAAFLKTLMDVSLDHGTDGGAFCLPWGLGIDVDGLSCPLGIKPAAWRLAIVNGNERDRLKLAGEFFPWWERDIGAPFFENMLRCLLWQHVQWRAPVTEQESRTLLEIEDAVAHLKALSGGVPRDLRAALKELDAAVGRGLTPTIDGIGYRRRPVVHEVFDWWHVTLPGTLAEEIADDGKAAHYFGSDVALRLSAISAKNTSGRSIVWPSVVEDAGQVDAHGLSRRVAAPEADGGRLSQFGVVVREAGEDLKILMLTLTVPDESGLAIFDDVLASIRFNTGETPRRGRD